MLWWQCNPSKFDNYYYWHMCCLSFVILFWVSHMSKYLQYILYASDSTVFRSNSTLYFALSFRLDVRLRIISSVKTDCIVCIHLALLSLPSSLSSALVKPRSRETVCCAFRTVLFVEFDLVYFLSCFSASILWFIDALLFVCMYASVAENSTCQIQYTSRHTRTAVLLIALSCVFLLSEWIQHNFTNTRSLRECVWELLNSLCVYTLVDHNNITNTITLATYYGKKFIAHQHHYHRICTACQLGKCYPIQV